MNRSEIIAELNNRYPKLSHKDAYVIVCSLFNFMAKSLANGKRIEIRGFGAFSIKHRPAGLVRNPRHDTVVESPARNVMYFRAGKELAERVNSRVENDSNK